jgi:hypothetical protein
MAYEISLHSKTQHAFSAYATWLRDEGIAAAGKYVSDRLHAIDITSVDAMQALTQLINTKKPRNFAESEVCGDGGDWTLEELSLLGGIGVATPVTVYDDGTHRNPLAHAKPFEATLLFIAGALLTNGRWKAPADWDRVVRNGDVDDELFLDLYESRLFPALKFANDQAEKLGKRAFITIPGVGCGQFAGRFQGRLATHFRLALIALLLRHSSDLTSVAAVYFDPYSECLSDTQKIGDFSFRTRPLLKTASPKPQLLRPIEYEEFGDDFSDCVLFSIVAWDHVSWPGNDFYVGMRTTDDGVKAAATSAMTSMTGFPGHYDVRSNCYVPDNGYQNWEDVVVRNSIQINATGNVHVYG